jgi:hypothetical protein
MTSDQFLTLVATLGGYVIAIFTIWYQGRREVDREKLRREWAVQDRDANRDWHVRDIEADRRREQLTEHQRFVEDFLEKSLMFATAHVLNLRNLKPMTDEEGIETFQSLLLQIDEVRHHAAVFDSEELNNQSEQVLKLLVDAPTPDKKEAAPYYPILFSMATARVSRTMESIIREARTLKGP